MRRIAITGVGGYLGARLLERLVADGVEVLGIDLRPPRPAPPALEFVRQDVSQPCDDLLRGHCVDAVVHLAFLVAPRRDWVAARAVNVGGAENVLRACVAAGVRQVVYLSSTTVYGAYPDNPVPLTEESSLRPVPGFQYGWHKAEADRLFQRFAAEHQDVRVAVLRGCVVIGPHADNFITQSFFQPVMVGVAGHNPPLQFVHEDDVVDVLLRVLGDEVCGVLNLAAPGVLSYSEVARLAGRRLVWLPARLLAALTDVTWRLRLQSQATSAGLAFIRHPWVASIQKLQRELGYSFRYSTSEAVAAFRQGLP